MIIEPSVIQVWLALALAVSGCIWLAKRQPEYPNTRVILTFALLGGALGGLLMALLGAIVGCLPATLCGLIWRGGVARARGKAWDWRRW